MPQDAILKIIAEFEVDERPNKIDLGVGVYRDQHGNTPILNTVKVAERRLVEQQTTKAYLGSSGYGEFNACMQALAFGESAEDHDRQRCKEECVLPVNDGRTQ